MQAGETVTSVNLGDSVRWQIQPAVSSGNITHILARPRQVGLDTSMVVTTDKRTYHIRLRSHRSEYMPRVRFNYIEDALAKWENIKAKAAEKRERDTIPETNEYLGDLDFNYSVKGNAPWKPVRVYNDGVKTILEMPARMRQTEAPTLAVCAISIFPAGHTIAASSFDDTGTTGFGKYVLNHSFMLPGLVNTAVSVVVAMLLGRIIL